MLPVWDGWGERHPCTILYLDSNVVLRVMKEDGVDGYNAVQVGAGERKVKRVTKPLMGHYAKCQSLFPSKEGRSVLSCLLLSYRFNSLLFSDGLNYLWPHFAARIIRPTA